MKKIILFFIILLFPLVIYGKNYLCIIEITTGLIKQQNGEWRSSRFEGSNYLISFENNSLKSVKKFGSDINLCDHGFRNSQNYNTSQCLGGKYGRIIEIFEFHTILKRFTRVYISGYTENISGDTPTIGGGKCSSF